MDDPRIAVLTEQIRHLHEELRDVRLQVSAFAESVRQIVSDSAVLMERTERLQSDTAKLAGRVDMQADKTNANKLEVTKRAAWIGGIWTAVTTGISIAAAASKFFGG